MTRIAPRPVGPRAAQRGGSVELTVGAPLLLSARWRLGLRGALTLAIDEAAADGNSPAVVTIA